MKRRWVELWAKYPVIAVKEMRAYRASQTKAKEGDEVRWLTGRLESYDVVLAA